MSIAARAVGARHRAWRSPWSRPPHGSSSRSGWCWCGTPSAPGTLTDAEALAVLTSLRLPRPESHLCDCLRWCHETAQRAHPSGHRSIRPARGTRQVERRSRAGRRTARHGVGRDPAAAVAPAAGVPQGTLGRRGRDRCAAAGAVRVEPSGRPGADRVLRRPDGALRPHARRCASRAASGRARRASASPRTSGCSASASGCCSTRRRRRRRSRRPSWRE